MTRRKTIKRGRPVGLPSMQALGPVWTYLEVEAVRRATGCNVPEAIRRIVGSPGPLVLQDRIDGVPFTLTITHPGAVRGRHRLDAEQLRRSYYRGRLALRIRGLIPR